MNRIGLIANPDKPDALQLMKELAKWLSGLGIEVVVEDEPAAAVGLQKMAATGEEVAASDMVVVLGGDGTVLRASRLAAPKGTPMFGIHFGQYGFITEIHPPDTKAALRRVLDGDYSISERMMLRARLVRGDEEVGSWTAMNDIVVSKGPLARMLSLHTMVCDRYVATYAADGIIVSSPTGSTAYSLSAGGPVVNPNVRVMIITPICPTIDGQLGFQLACSDKVDVSKSEFPARMVTLDPWSFYSKLQTRLRWGERFSG